MIPTTVRNGLANLSRARDDAKLGKLHEPPPPPLPNPLEGHDVALYVDGRRVSLTFLDITPINDAEVSIVMETAIAAALDPTVDAVMTLTWGGFSPNQTVNYRVAPTKPAGGVLQIREVRLPSVPGGPAYFVGTALTDLFDWSDDGRKIAVAGDTVEILTTHVERQ